MRESWMLMRKPNLFVTPLSAISYARSTYAGGLSRLFHSPAKVVAFVAVPMAARWTFPADSIGFCHAVAMAFRVFFSRQRGQMFRVNAITTKTAVMKLSPFGDRAMEMRVEGHVYPLLLPVYASKAVSSLFPLSAICPASGFEN